jgi:hypothetical protein
VDAMEHRGLVRFWIEWGWIRDVSNLAYSKCEGVSDFFEEWGGSRFRGVYRFIPNIGGMSRVMGWPSVNTNMFLITSRDLKFGVGDKGVESFVPPDKEPGVVDKFKGEVSLRGGMDSIGSLFQSFMVLPEGFTKQVFW